MCFVVCKTTLELERMILTTLYFDCAENTNTRIICKVNIVQLRHQSIPINLMHNQAYYKVVIQKKRQELLVGCTGAFLELDRG
jgi:hypothetical protein